MRSLAKFVATLIISAAGLASAQQLPPDVPGAPPSAGRRIGLAEALEQAVKGNRTLSSQRLDIDVAEAQILQSTGLDDYIFDASANWNSRRTQPVAGQPFQQTASDTFSLSAGISKPLSDGGRLGARLGGDYNRTVTQLELGPDMTTEFSSEVWSPSLTVNYFQPLLRGFGDKTARASRTRARLSRDVATLDRTDVAATAIREVVHAYWELAYAAQDLEIRRQSLTLAREQQRITQARLDVGVGAPTDLAAVEQTIAVREEDVLLAEQNVTDRSLELRRVIASDIKAADIDVIAGDRLVAAVEGVDVEAALAMALDRNPQIVTVRARGKLAQLEVDVTKNGLLPQLDFSASIGPYGNADGLGEAFGQLVTLDNYAVQAGLTFSSPLGNSAAKGAHEVARAQLRRVKVTEEDLRAQVSVAVVRAVNLVRSAQKRLEVLQTATRLALVNLDAEKARYEVGRTTNFEVLRRQDELAQSQLRSARATADYLKARAVLDALTGEILPRYNIKMRD
jgi:outer membrane protein